MTYGLQVWNNGGFIQIDHDFSNYVLLQEGVANTGTQVTFPFVNAVPIIMVGKTPASRDVYLRQLYQNSFTLYSGPYYAVNVFAINYRVYVPAYAVSPGTPGYGMRVHRADGSLAFDSDYRYMHPSQVLQFTSTLMPSTPTNLSGTYNIGHSQSGNFFVSLNETSTLGGRVESDETVAEYFIAYDIKDFNIGATWEMAAGSVASFPASEIFPSDRMIVIEVN